VPPSPSAILVYQENDNDSGGSKFGGALLNALIFVGIILVATCVIVVLYKYRCLKAIYGWLIMSCVSLLGFFGGLTLWQILEINGLPIDWLSLAFIVWNFAVVGIIAIFWRAPLLMQQGYLVAVSALLAVNLTNLPEWTTWMILAAVAVYDLFAVLAPRGPLKVLVETSQERNEPIPGLVYNAESVKLGLGDFIFYSILVARGATIGDDTTVAACYIAILAGMCGTIMLLALVKKALPALPFSIGLGIIFYFLTRAVVVPYIGQFSTQQIYL
jgi:presenilin 1